jgi:hypothetical protein
MIMKNTLTLLCINLIVLAVHRAAGQAPALPAQFGPHQWTATVKVIGEDGNPIAGADVSAQYDVQRPAGSDQPTFGDVRGLTDSNGIFVASHTDSSWNLGVIAEKPGYYATHTGWQFYFTDKRRHPSFTLMLKKIGKPIQMYAKSVNLGVPVFNKPVGFDLEAGDWVAPYGKGATTDFVFTVTNSTIVVNFPNARDGIQGFTRDWSQGVSGLLSSNEAPAEGYQPEYEQTHMPNPNRIYYFRVRTVLDSQGNVLSTHYGKIYGDFMQFTYYLNPTPNDRNVEFDPKQNLLGGVKSFEQVQSP